MMSFIKCPLSVVGMCLQGCNIVLVTFQVCQTFHTTIVTMIELPITSLIAGHFSACAFL